MPNKHVEIEWTWFERASDATVTTSVVALLYVQSYRSRVFQVERFHHPI